MRSAYHEVLNRCGTLIGSIDRPHQKKKKKTLAVIDTLLIYLIS